MAHFIPKLMFHIFKTFNILAIYTASVFRRIKNLERMKRWQLLGVRFHLSSESGRKSACTSGRSEGRL